MENKLVLLVKFLEELWVKKFTGQLRLNFHEGNLSEKIEKKESVKLSEDEIKPLKNKSHCLNDVGNEE